MRVTVEVEEATFWEMFDKDPHDPALQAKACQLMLATIHPPIPKGRTQSGIPIYRDEGWNGSGYVVVHWDAAKGLSWCLDNGYIPNGFPESELPLIWDEDPERERLLAIQGTLLERAYA